MEGAKSPVGVCELKAGVKIEGVGVVKDITFRELAGAEEDILASQKMRVSDKLTKVMQNCAMKIGNAEDRPTINSAVKKLISVDRWLYLVKLRILSVGAMYKFSTKCPECGHDDVVTYDLNQIEVKCDANADDLFKETKLPSGKVVRWRVADGDVEAKIESRANDSNAPTVALYARLDTIDDKPASIDAVQAMSFNDRPSR